MGGGGGRQVKEWRAKEIRGAWGGLLNSVPHIRWVNHPLGISAASYKPEQLARAQRYGLRIPETVMTTNTATALAFCERHNCHVIAKPVVHGEILADNEGDDRLAYENRVA